MQNIHLTLVAIFFTIALSGCAKDAVVQPPQVAELYSLVGTNTGEGSCASMATEISEIDAGLGRGAIDDGPPVPATAGARWADYGKDLIVQTVIGPLQPIIQTVKASINYDDKKRIQSESIERAEMRRAFLIGKMDGLGCPGA